MNFCPPKPGSTVITSTMSRPSRYGYTASAGVAGFSAAAAFTPSSLSSAIHSAVLPLSRCTVIRSAPAFTKSGMYFSGSLIIRCTSKDRAVRGRRHFTMGAPSVMLGTKCPSITSMCSRSAPASCTLRASSPSLEKSDARMEGDIFFTMLRSAPFSFISLFYHVLTYKANVFYKVACV